MRTIRPLLIFACLFMVAAGCHRSSPGSKPGSTVFRYPMVEEPPTLDPARLNDIYITELLQNVYEGLVTIDSHNKIVACLAERWEIDPSAKIYTFHLRSDARFHNGRPITSADVKYSLERSLDPKTNSPVAANYLGPIVGAAEVASGKRKDLTGVATPDDRTLIITIDRPRGYFLGCLTYPCAWIVCKEATPKSGSPFGKENSVGGGAFRFVEYKPGGRVVLEAFDRYWAGRPKIDRIERPIVLDYATAHIMFENGEVDAASITLADYENDLSSSKLKPQILLLPQANISYLVMHERLQPIFADVRVRRAFAMAIDRQQIAKTAYHGGCPAAYSFVPPGMPGENPAIRKIPYDPAAARKLLADAGFPGGQRFPHLTLEYPQKNMELGDAALIVRDNLKQNLEIDVDVREHEMGSFFRETAEHETIPFHLTGWIADYLDPQDFLSTLLRTGASLNHTAYSNPAFDRLCDEADALSDMSKRIPLYQKADQIAMDDVAFLPIADLYQPLLVKPYVQNLESSLMVPMLPHKRTTIGPH